MNSSQEVLPSALESSQANVGTLSPPRRRIAGREHPHFESYELLLANLRQAMHELDASASTIGITSCFHGAGVTTVAANLATVAAQTLETGVLLVDSNFARPSLHATLEHSLAPGLGECLSGETALSECISETPFEHLCFLPAGTTRFGSDEIGEFAALITELKSNHGIVVVDLPPVEESTACLSLARQLDGVLLVMPVGICGTTARQTTEELQFAGVNVLGVVLNG